MLDKYDISYARMAQIWAENSYATKLKVGALIVKDRTIIADGFNGSPTGFDNTCEDENGKTWPYILHAEANAISKLAKGTTSSIGATIYITAAPCINCSKLIIQAGIVRVIYSLDYKNFEGIDLLRTAGIKVLKINLQDYQK